MDKNENISEATNTDSPPKYTIKKPPNIGPKIRFTMNVADFIFIPIIVSSSLEDISGIRDTPKGISSEEAALKIIDAVMITSSIK